MSEDSDIGGDWGDSRDSGADYVGDRGKSRCWRGKWGSGHTQNTWGPTKATNVGLPREANYGVTKNVTSDF